MKHVYPAFTLGLASLLAGGSTQAQDMRSFTMGSAVPAAAGQRSIVLDADTRWVNVNQGEQIRFIAGNKEFGWRFDASGAHSFNLQQIAPAGALSRPVQVYIMSSGGHPTH